LVLADEGVFLLKRNRRLRNFQAGLMARNRPVCYDFLAIAKKSEQGKRK
jgi:hypothetical protein